MDAAKKNLRKIIAEKRALLNEETILRSDQQILQNLLALPQYQKAKTVFCFVGTKEEINTKPIILDALSKGKRVCVPLCVTLGVMHAHEITGLHDLQPGKYGIEEPKAHCPYVAPRTINFVIVPCVTCNHSGQRLGYGAGFYDRYLENMTAPKAVLCRSALMNEEIPVDSHDVVIETVVTDERVFGVGAES